MVDLGGDESATMPWHVYDQMHVDALIAERDALKDALRIAVDLASRHSDHWTKDHYRQLAKVESILKGNHSDRDIA